MAARRSRSKEARLRWSTGWPQCDQAWPQASRRGSGELKCSDPWSVRREYGYRASAVRQGGPAARQCPGWTWARWNSPRPRTDSRPRTATDLQPGPTTRLCLCPPPILKPAPPTAWPDYPDPDRASTRPRTAPRSWAWTVEHHQTATGHPPACSTPGRPRAWTLFHQPHRQPERQTSPCPARPAASAAHPAPDRAWTHSDSPTDFRPWEWTVAGLRRKPSPPDRQAHLSL